MAGRGTQAGSEYEGMAEFAKQLWERYFRRRAIAELKNHALDGYKAQVVSNNGDGTLTVIRPFDAQTMTLRCPPALATWADENTQVLVVSLGDESNSFVLCATNIDGFESTELSDEDPLMDGAEPDPGTAGKAARGDHVHPSDTSRVPVTRTINGYDLTQDINLTAADVGALALTGTANRAKQLSAAHYFASTSGQWYKVLEIPMSVNGIRHLILTVNSAGGRYCGIVYCYFCRVSGAASTATRVRWFGIEGFSTDDLRFTAVTADGVTTFALYLRARAGNYVYISTIRAMTSGETWDPSPYWLSTAVSEPPSTATAAMGPAAVYDGYGNGISATYAKRSDLLWFSAVAVSAGTGQQIISLSDSAITDEHVLARLEFTDPANITEGYSWTTGAGTFSVTGTATAATTANILLIRKGN